MPGSSSPQTSRYGRLRARATARRARGERRRPTIALATSVRWRPASRATPDTLTRRRRNWILISVGVMVQVRSICCMIATACQAGART